MPRAAIYARYSSDLQSAASIADQERLCRERAARDGLDVVEVYADAAISAAAAVTRPGLMRLLEHARERRFDVVIAEALDRLSRDQEDIAALHKRLRFAGIAIVTLAEGAVDELHIGLKGTMNALFLRDLAAKTKRGQRGRVEAGRIPGGLTYGYRMVRELDGAGEVERGLRAIEPAEAAIVRRIFEAYAAGMSARAIALMLNREGVPAPRGGAWAANTIAGNKARRNGVLHNELYRGRLIYNRQSFVKNPETGRRQPRPNPPAAWIAKDLPELAIVSAELWAAAETRHARHAGRPAHIARRPRRLLSGLVRCASCGGAFTITSGEHMACTTRREKGTCGNAATIAYPKLEARVFAGLEAALLEPAAIAEFVAEVEREIARRRQAAGGRRQALAREAAEIERRLGRMVAAIETGTAGSGEAEAPAAMIAAMRQAEARRSTIAAELAALAGAEPVRLRPELADVYRRQVARLKDALAGAAPAARAAAIEILRTMVEAVTIAPPAAPGSPPAIELRGQLAGILNAMHGPETQKAAASSEAAAFAVIGVAGGRFVRYRTAGLPAFRRAI